jgi:hypothetical protein
MYWAHFCGFIIVLLTFELKEREYHDLKQFLQFLLMAFYFICSWYTVYITKIWGDEWLISVDPVRIWLYIESAYIFKWIFSSMIFMTIAHFFKL